MKLTPDSHVRLCCFVVIRSLSDTLSFLFFCFSVLESQEYDYQQTSCKTRLSCRDKGIMDHLKDWIDSKLNLEVSLKDVVLLREGQLRVKNQGSPGNQTRNIVYNSIIFLTRINPFRKQCLITLIFHESQSKQYKKKKPTNLISILLTGTPSRHGLNSLTVSQS